MTQDSVACQFDTPAKLSGALDAFLLQEVNLNRVEDGDNDGLLRPVTVTTSDQETTTRN